MQVRGWGMYDLVGDQEVEAVLARKGHAPTGGDALLQAARRVQQLYMPRVREPALEG